MNVSARDSIHCISSASIALSSFTYPPFPFNFSDLCWFLFCEWNQRMFDLQLFEKYFSRVADESHGCVCSHFPCQSHVYILLFFDLLNRRHLKRKINLSSHFDSLRLPASQTWLRKKEDEKRPPEKISKIYFVNVFDRALATTASEESILSGTCRNDADRTGDAAVVANYSLTE